MLHNNLINRKDFDNIFNELAAEYIKCGGSKNINIYLVGGAAIVLGFDYRLSTIDVDAYFENSNALQTAISKVSSLMNLPADWLNSDFVNTPSYSRKIVDIATKHSSYLNVINVYTLEPKYIISMKLKSSRPAGGDLDDIIKMIYELRFKKANISYDDVIMAYEEMYDDYSNTYDYFLEKAKEAFDKPIEEVNLLFDNNIE